MCAHCFETVNEFAPDMGDTDFLTYAPGTCNRCGLDRIVFDLLPDFKF